MNTPTPAVWDVSSFLSSASAASAASATSASSAVLSSTTLVDISKLLALANKAFGKSVDCDMRGRSITDLDVLLWGAYGPAVMRLVNLAVQRHIVALAQPAVRAGASGIQNTLREGHTPLSLPQLYALADEAFSQVLDYDFGNHPMHNFSILRESEYGYGKQVAQLVDLALQSHSELLGCSDAT